MPTSLPRHAVTETDEITQILDDASQRWADASRAKLIVLVMRDWARGGASPLSRARAREELAGSLPGSSELYDRAGDWPA
ncbi:MAG: hypothetical protein OXL98_16375 [Acidimicrobiaceae bacterium]|nr:hypothetical protein [Acidimicrobiaceae bacterium]